MAASQPRGLRSGESAEELLDAVLTAVPAFITRVDARFVVRSTNLVHGSRPPSAVVGTDVFDLIAPAYRQVARRCFEEVQASLQPGRYDSEATGAGGAVYTNYVAPIDDGDDGVGLCIVGVDVTEQRDRQAALHSSQAQLDLAVRATGIGLWSWEIESNRVEWNDRMLEITGRTEPADLQTYIEDIVHPEDRELVMSRSQAMVAAGRFEAYHHRIRATDGTDKGVLTVGHIETSDGGEPVRIMGGMLDVTEQRRLEDRLRETEHRQSLAHLTAGVAHNFNNLLMVMMPTLELLKETVPPENRDDVVHALAAAERSAQMVRHLMTIGRTESRIDERESTEVGALLRDLAAMTRSVLPMDLELVVDLADDPVEAAINPSELEHVVLNLILNARDAVENVRRPRIEVRAARSAGSDAGSVRLEVSDNGVGMPDEVRRRMFEPFFTTKRALGTGLGLSSAHALVVQAGGTIRCDSAPGRGTRFTIELPQASPGSDASVSAGDPESISPCRVLLVDDDDSVRRVVGRMLARSGFTVIDAASVKAAEALLDDPETLPMEVVLLDRNMPEQSGIELLPTLGRLAPRAKVLLFSGDPGEPPPGIDGVITKPIQGPGLIDHIHRVLSTPDSSRSRPEETAEAHG